MLSDRMIENAKNALLSVLNMKETDTVLIITDTIRKDVGYAFSSAVERLNGQSELYFLPESRPIKDVPNMLTEQIQKRKPQIIINAFEGYPEETPFRIKLVKMEINTNAKVGHGPGITENMLDGGPMSVDYNQLMQNAEYLIKQFDNADEVQITAPSGTNITLCIRDRKFETDVRIRPGTFGNLPCGEIWCAPVESKGNGIIVADGSIGDLGQVNKPLTIKVKDGKITSISSEDEELAKKVIKLTSIDEFASVVGELGIGINPSARITGNLLEDEKAGRTAHIAFGNNEEMQGGKNKSKTHRDFLFHKPTLIVRYIDGSERTVIKEGEVVR